MNVEIVSFIVTFYVSQPSFTSNMKKKRKKRETQSVTVENETVQDEMHDIILLQLNSETDGFQRERTSAEAQLKQVRLWNRRIPTINLLSFSTDRQTWATVPSPSMLHSFAQSLDLTAPWPFCRQLRPKEPRLFQLRHHVHPCQSSYPWSATRQKTTTLCNDYLECARNSGRKHNGTCFETGFGGQRIADPEQMCCQRVQGIRRSADSIMVDCEAQVKQKQMDFLRRCDMEMQRSLRNFGCFKLKLLHRIENSCQLCGVVIKDLKERKLWRNPHRLFTC